MLERAEDSLVIHWRGFMKTAADVLNAATTAPAELGQTQQGQQRKHQQRKQKKKPQTEKYTNTGSAEPKVESGPYARQKRSPLIRPASEPDDTSATTEYLEPPGHRTVSDPGPYLI